MSWTAILASHAAFAHDALPVLADQKIAWPNFPTPACVGGHVGSGLCSQQSVQS